MKIVKEGEYTKMKNELITFVSPKTQISEVFRTLRTNIQFMNVDEGLKSLLITSTVPGEGKSWNLQQKKMQKLFHYV